MFEPFRGMFDPIFDERFRTMFTQTLSDCTRRHVAGLLSIPNQEARDLYHDIALCIIKTGNTQ